MKLNILKMYRLRMIAAGGLAMLLVAGDRMNIDWGTLCALCPVGLLEISAASRAVPPFDMIWPVLLVMAAVLLLGKFLCAWICPTGLLKGVFRKSGETASICAAESAAAVQPYWGQGTGYAVLAAALAASFIFGFPVFCLICPVGLFFGFIFALYKVSTIYQPGWELVIFPVMLGVELFLFKSWCRVICPMGLIFKLAGSLNPFRIAPKVQSDTCLLSKDASCQICRKACPEQLAMPECSQRELADCTLCMECYEQCPVQAIKISKS